MDGKVIEGLARCPHCPDQEPAGFIATREHLLTEDGCGTGASLLVLICRRCKAPLLWVPNGWSQLPGAHGAPPTWAANI